MRLVYVSSGKQVHMKRIILPTLILLAGLTGCLKENDLTSTLITDPVSTYLGTDTLQKSGDLYMGLQLGATPEELYPVIQTLQKTSNVGYVNVVANSFTKLSDLEKRIPLYQAIDLEQSNGVLVKVYFTEKSVSAIYLSTGRQLTQWPESVAKSRAIAMGDAVGGLYEKIKALSSAATFKSFNLFTKDLTTDYDPAMSLSPQWYFAFSPTFGQTTLVHLSFSDQKLKSIMVSKFRQGS